MTVDIFDPGPDGSFPWLPRTAEGRLDTTRVPVGLRWQTDADGRRHRISLTPSVRLPNGQVVPVTEVCAP